jgi:hypothetical protein
MNVLFINDSTSNSNWGDRAAAISLRAMISALGGRITQAVTEDELYNTSFGEPAAGLTAGSSAGPKEVMKQFVPPVVLKLRRRLKPHADSSRTRRLIPHKWGDFRAAAEEVVGGGNPWPALMESIDRVDVVVIHGDGAMVDCGIIPRTMLFLAYLVKKHCGKAVIIVNHTADFSHPDLRRMAQEVYPLLDDVVFRDPTSAELCRTMCDGRYAADSAFWFAPVSRETWLTVAARPTYFDVWPDRARFDPSEPYVCIGGSSIFGVAGDASKISSDYGLLAKHIKSLYSGQIVLTVSDFIDERILRPISRALDLPLISLTTPVPQAVDVLGNSDAYIGGRWHSGIFSLRGGAPIVPLSARTFKMQALADSAGLATPTFDSLDLATAAVPIGQQLMSCLEQGNELRNRLRKWADERADNCWDNLAYFGSREE